MKGLTVACALVAVTAALSACGGSHRVPQVKSVTGTSVAVRTVSSSRPILGGTVRCTATGTTPVQAGQNLGVTFAFQNVSDHAVRVGTAPWDVRFILKAGDGTGFDTNTLVSPTIPYIAPTRLAPGATKTVPGVGSLVRVRWKGPLQITPMCGQTRLPVLRVGVIGAGPPANVERAVADVVAAAGHLFDNCRPLRADVPVRGQIDAPDGNAPPLDASCSVRIRREGRFWLARALVLSPPGLRYANVSRPFGRPAVKPGRNAEEIVWEFVVTRNGATSVDSAEADASKSADRMATFWSWTGSRWVKAGDGRCGGFGSNSGGGAPRPSITFVSVCR